MDQEQVKKAIEDFLGKLGVDITSIEVIETPAHPIFMVHSSDSGLLIGTHGDHLRAINMILKRVIENTLGEEQTKFLLDVNNYHKKEIDELEKQAKLSSERVKLFGTDVELEPMNAYNRMLIHALFNDDEDITTESRGDGPYRHVVLKKKGETAQIEADA